MHSRILNVLRDGVQQDAAVLRHGVDVDLARVLDELGDDHWLISRDLAREIEESRELVLRVRHVHRGPREHVRRAYEARVADVLAKGERILVRREHTPFWLVDANRVAQRRKLVAVLGGVDHLGRSACDLDVALLHREGEGVRDLAAHRDHCLRAALGLVDVEHALERELLEVEPVALVIVRRDGLGVIVDHHGLLAHLAQRADGRDGAPIELDGRADAVHAGAEHHGARLVELDVVLVAVVRHVQVVGGGGELGGHRVDLLRKGQDAHRLACLPDVLLEPASAISNLPVREARLFGLQHRGRGQGCGRELFEDLVHVRDPPKLVQEPRVDFGERLDAIDAVALLERKRERVDTLVVGDAEKVLEGTTLRLEARRLEALRRRVRHAQRLL